MSSKSATKLLILASAAMSLSMRAELEARDDVVFCDKLPEPDWPKAFDIKSPKPLDTRPRKGDRIRKRQNFRRRR